jgi:carbamoyl-phosphate synthase large subunit
MNLLLKAKQMGFSDRQIAALVGSTEDEVRALRKKLGLLPSYRLVDTCAAEFEAYTPYYYSTYDRDDDEVRHTDTRKVMILGGGPNRIGQGIEFDYCCVHAAFALKELGFETIMVNSNPETVSTDYDTSDKLYFEPLTLEDVLHIYEREKCWGAIAQFGGQTPLNLALGLQKNGVNIIGTSPQSIEIAEDRKLFAAMLDKLRIPQPPNGLATNEEEALAAAKKVGYPVLVRPSFVLGGRAMQIVYADEELRYYMRHAVEASPERPVLVDKFLEEAIEVDVDCIADIGVGGETIVIGGFLEHIEFAGCHSGDAAMVLPPHSLAKDVIETMRQYTHAMARELKVAGLMNVQFAVKGKDVWVLEVNPRASRTVPFVSKAIGHPLAKLASKVMTGKKLTELGFTAEVWPKYFSVKESVFPFSKFPGQDILLGPEMRSTGEVMGIGRDWGMAYAKSQMAAQPALPDKGKVFLSVRDSDKPHAAKIGKDLAALGFELCATDGTAAVLEKEGLTVQRLFKVQEGRPNCLDLIKNGEVQLVINTPAGKSPRADEVKIRTAAVMHRISIMTTLASAKAAVLGIKTLRERGLKVHSLQEYHARKK